MAERLLRACLVGLVLVDLWFVHLTEAARPAWLAPLLVLTLAAPLCAALRDKLAYRALWNVGVLGFFALLVHHATGDDLRYVLEDGLILAALCQVHLLNNLSSEQRPDLLFLNSFLIAIVAGYLCQELAFALAFALYAPLLIVALCLHGLVGAGMVLGPRDARRVLADGLLRAAALLVLALAAFAFWPRDFQRQGLLAAHLDLSSRTGEEVGFDDSLSLERRGRVEASDEVVFRVRLERGASADVPSLWRGATLMSTNGDSWWPLADGDPGGGFGADHPWRGEGRDLLRSQPGSGTGLLAEVSVESLENQSGRLFAPLSAERLRLDAKVGRVVALADGTLALGEIGVVGPPARFRLALGPASPMNLGGRTPRELDPRVRACVQLPNSRHIRAAHDLAGELALEVSGRDQHELVAHFSAELEARCAYLPPGDEDGAGSLEEFLGGAGGHCEFFASALATMLRSRGVPCRVVTGFRSMEWDAGQRVLTFRRRHAHAWVEVLDPQAGWYAVDPNPTSAAASGPTALARLRAELALAWEQLTGFNSERRAQLLAAARALPARVLAGLVAEPWLAGVLLLGAAAAAAAETARRRRRKDPAIRSYERALGAAGLVLGPGETPRELLERARALALDAQRFERLSRATREHEHRRYAGATASARR